MPRAAALILGLLVAPGCRTPDPKAELALSEVEGYWAVDAPVADTQYLAPVVRFRLENKSATSRSIEAKAAFRRDGETVMWSEAWRSVSPLDGNPLRPGQSRFVMLKPEGEGRYTYRGRVDEMFKNREFKDVTAEISIRVGPSRWTRFLDVKVERRLGSHTVDAFK